jgi:hypothetical protein
LNQLSFFNIQKSKPDGADLRDKGIARAVQHAEEIHEKWQAKALDFLYIFARNHDRFSGEMVRVESKGVVPDPPSLRAWGSVLLSGSKRGWIKQIDYIKVVNPKAHRTPAALWESLL